MKTFFATILLVTFLVGACQAALQQYTPDQANWSTFYSKVRDAGITAHDPDSVNWISEADWIAARWDGTIYNPSRMTPAAFVSAICPSVDRVRGIREVFYRHNPFADNANPTKAEVDEWHRIALNHVRALIGYTTTDRQVEPDTCMFARALWGDERKFTTMWDAEYPGTSDAAAGPCQDSDESHCGATFIPSAEDQAPYLPDDFSPCFAGQGSEGIFSGPKSNIPWSLKWSRGLCNTLHAEGFWGGHTGPFFHRQKFGFSFWDPQPSVNGNNAILRAKWTGNLMPNLYCNPSDPNCDPENTGPPPTSSTAGNTASTTAGNTASTTAGNTASTTAGNTASTSSTTTSTTTDDDEEESSSESSSVQTIVSFALFVVTFIIFGLF